MASAPLNWLLKIGGATLKTTAKTLSEAVNTLHDTVTNLGTTVTNLGTSKADASTTTTALNKLETNKLNISDLLSLEEIEASTSLTGKGVTAESIKSLNNSLTFPDGTTFYSDIQDGKRGFNTDPNRGADTFFPFKNCELKKATVPAFTGATKSVSTDGKAHVIMLAMCSNNGNTYNAFAIYSDGEYGDSFTINRGSEPGKTGTFIQNVTDSGFTINLGVSNIVNSAICYYIT